MAQLTDKDIFDIINSLPKGFAKKNTDKNVLPMGPADEKPALPDIGNMELPKNYETMDEKGIDDSLVSNPVGIPEKQKAGQINPITNDVEEDNPNKIHGNPLKELGMIFSGKANKPELNGQPDTDIHTDKKGIAKPFDLINQVLGNAVGTLSSFDPTRLLDKDNQGIIQNLLGVKSTPGQFLPSNYKTDENGYPVAGTNDSPSLMQELTSVGSKAKNAAMGVAGTTPASMAIAPVTQALGLGNPMDYAFGNLGGSDGSLPGGTGAFSGQPGQQAVAGSAPSEGEVTSHNDRTIDKAIANLQMRDAYLSQMITLNPRMAGQYKAILDKDKESIQTLQDSRTKQLQIRKDTMTQNQAIGDSVQGAPNYDRLTTDSAIYTKMNTILEEAEKAIKQHHNMVEFTQIINEGISTLQALNKTTMNESLRNELNASVAEMKGLLGSGTVYLPQNIEPTMRAFSAFTKTSLQDFNTAMRIAFRRQAPGSPEELAWRKDLLGTDVDKNGNPSNDYLTKFVSRIDTIPPGQYIPVGDIKDSKPQPGTQVEMQRQNASLYKTTGEASGMLGIGKAAGTLKALVDSLHGDYNIEPPAKSKTAGTILK